MRVFVAGASGVIGRPLLRRLVADGHEVTGMTRSEQRAVHVREAGADATICDVFDRAALDAAVARAEPDVVVHQLTSLPQQLDIRKKGVYDANNRIREEGTRNLVAATRAARARRMVAQSVAFIYEPLGGWVKTEDDPPMGSASGEFGSSITATLSLEQQVLGADGLDGLDGLVLRYGFFYGPKTSYARDGHQASEVRKRRFPIVGGGSGVFSFVQIEDAAAATVAACEQGAPGIYNITDDEPAPVRDWLPAYAEAVGAKKPMRIPKLVARLIAGPDVVAFATTLRGASNAKARDELGWAPEYSSWRTGFERALG